jgi:hypothetical protein
MGCRKDKFEPSKFANFLLNPGIQTFFVLNTKDKPRISTHTVIGNDEEKDDKLMFLLRKTQDRIQMLNYRHEPNNYSFLFIIIG